MTNSFTGFVPAIWSKKFIKLYDKLTVMQGLVNTDFEGDIQNFGDTVHVRQFGDVAINTYTRNGNITITDVSGTDNTLVIDQSKHFAFKVDDLDKAQSDINIMEGYLKRAAVGIRNTIDSRLLSHYVDAAPANVQGSTSLPTTLTPANVYDAFVDMATTFANANQDPDMEMHAVVNPTVRAIILKSPELRDRSTTMVDESIKNGRVGKFGGFTVHVTTNYSAVNGTIPLLFFNRDFISFASQLNKIESVRQENSFADLVKGLYLYGSKVFATQSNAGGVIYVSNV